MVESCLLTSWILNKWLDSVGMTEKSLKELVLTEQVKKWVPFKIQEQIELF